MLAARYSNAIFLRSKTLHGVPPIFKSNAKKLSTSKFNISKVNSSFGFKPTQLLRKNIDTRILKYHLLADLKFVHKRQEITSHLR